MRKGICVAGTTVVDKLIPIKEYPGEGRLTTIQGEMKSRTGGALCNVIIDLARLDPAIDLQAIGRIGKDGDGAFIKKELQEYRNIDLSLVHESGITSYSCALTSEATKQRTFFYHPGANTQLRLEDFPLDEIKSKIFHIGYILILDALDAPDNEYGTKMARLLAMLQQKGIETSVDVVSEMGDRFKKLVPPALKYTTYYIINETEAEEVTSVRLRDSDGKLLTENMPAALAKLFECGVGKWAVIHAPEGGFGMDGNKNYISLNSLSLPAGFIKGTVGAGDAFTAGVLLGAYHGKDLEESILLGTCAAAASLSEEDASSGVGRIDEVMKLSTLYG